MQLNEADALAAFTAISQNSFAVLLKYLDDQHDYLEIALTQPEVETGARHFYAGAIAHNRDIKAGLEALYAQAQAPH